MRRSRLTLPSPTRQVDDFVPYGFTTHLIDIEKHLTTGPINIDNYDVFFFDFDDTLLAEKCHNMDKFREVYMFLSSLAKVKLVVVISHQIKWDMMLEQSGMRDHKAIQLDSASTSSPLGTIWYVPALNTIEWMDAVSEIKLDPTPQCGIEKVRSSKAETIDLVLRTFRVDPSARIIFFDDYRWILCNAKFALEQTYPNLSIYIVDLGNNDAILDLNIFNQIGGGAYAKYRKYKTKYLALKQAIMQGW